MAPYAYPLSLPATPAPAQTRLWIKRVNGMSESPTTGVQQLYEHPYHLWQATVTLPPMTREKAGEWQAFFLMLRGRAGTFVMGDRDAKVPRGLARAGQVNGANQVGNTINVRGLGANQGLKPGDYLQVGSGGTSRLHMIVLEHGGTPGGTAVFTVEPPLKASPPDGSTVTLVNARGLWRLSTDDVGWDADAASIYGFSFSCHEAL